MNTEADMNTAPLDVINAARAEYGFAPIKRRYRWINIYAKLTHGRMLYLDRTCWARNLKEAREMYVATMPRTGYAASDLTAEYAA